MGDVVAGMEDTSMGDVAAATLLQLEIPKIKMMITHPRMAMVTVVVKWVWLWLWCLWLPEFSSRLLMIYLCVLVLPFLISKIIIWSRQSHFIHVTRCIKAVFRRIVATQYWQRSGIPHATSPGMWPEMRWICMQTLAVQIPTGMWLTSLEIFVRSIHFLTHMNQCKRCHWPNVPQCLLAKMMVQICCSWQIRCYGLEPNYLLA